MAVGVAAALVAIPTDLAWYVDIDPRVPARRVAAAHLRLNVMVTVLFAINLLWRLSVEQVTSTPRGPLTMPIAGVVMRMRSDHLGGELVYHYGIGRQKR